ncbi:MAG TPA: hypothetical protein VF719_12565 [Abditibacteriaceae bacterium]|jgi:CHASE2 domain-containing sensor protein
MFEMWPLYLLLFLFVYAWLRVELKRQQTSTGVGSIILGSLVISYGFFLKYSGFFGPLVIAVGFAIAFFGVSKLAAHHLKNNS